MDGLPAPADEVPRWRPVPLLRLLGSSGPSDRRVQLLLLGWLGITALVVASALAVAGQGWSGLPLQIGGLDLSLTLHLPLVLCTWLVFWLGLEWAFIPAWTATFVSGLTGGLALGWAGVFGLAAPLGLVVIALAYRSAAIRYDLRSFPSAVFYVAVSAVAALAGSSGALIWSYQRGLPVTETLTVWEGWWVGAFLQAIVITAPVLAVASGAVERLKRQTLGEMAPVRVTLRGTVASIFVWGAVVAGFVWGATGLLRARLEAALAAGGASVTRSFVQDAIGSWALVGGAMLLLPLVAGGVVLAVAWHRSATLDRASHDSEARYRNLYEHAPDMYLSIDTTGRIVQCNETAARTLGWPKPNILGRSVFEFYHPRYVECARQAFQRFTETGELRDVELAVCRRDGSTLPVSLSVTAIRDAQGRISHSDSVWRDISERKRADERLRISTAAAEQAKDAVMITTADLDAPGPEIVYVNPAFTDLTGYTADEIIGQTPRVLQGPDTDRSTLEELRSALQSGRSYSGAIVNYRKDGTPFDVEFREISLLRDDDGRVVHYVAILRDVTHERAAERAIRASEERFRRLMARAWDGILLVDGEGTIRFTSESVRQVLGYAPAERVGRSIFELLPPDDATAAREAFRRLLGEPGGTVTLELRVRHRDGSWRWVETVATNLLDDPSVGAIVLNYRDISEPRRAEGELRRSRETLRDLAQRLLVVREEERTAMAREIHDELGQALTALKMDVAWLDSHLTTGGGRVRKHLEAMRELVDETVETVRRIATELRPGVLDDLGLAAAIQWQTDEFERRTGVRTTVELASRDPGLDDARATTVFRILQEALTNVARHAGAREVRVRLAVSAGVTTLEVTDDGRGIGEGDLAEATGLGIPGMRERAGLWGGALEIARGPQGGTLVTARIPHPPPEGLRR